MQIISEMGVKIIISYNNWIGIVKRSIIFDVKPGILQNVATVHHAVQANVLKRDAMDYIQSISGKGGKNIRTENYKGWLKMPWIMSMYDANAVLMT